MSSENIEISRLANGVRVVSETVTHVQSVSVGIWVGAGSRGEETSERGITHFIEHMLFKGTERRTARQIADEIESRGGSLNAFTDKEYTCYYAKALAEHVDIVMDVLSDMLRHSVLDPEELAREQNVVLEEIKRYKDTPDDTIHDIFLQTLWSSHPLGRPVIGVEKTVGAIRRQDIIDYMSSNYTPDRIVVSVSGAVPHALVVELAEKFLGSMSGAPKTFRSKAPISSGKSKHVRKKTEQVHFCYGSNAYPQLNDKRYALTLLDSVLGGNMSSRLFQEIREKRGLAYSIGSYNVAYREGGLFTIYGGTSPDTFEEVLDLTRTEISKVKRENVSEDEVSKAKNQIRGALILGLENMSSRMMRMGKNLLYFDRVIPISEIRTKIEAVTMDDLSNVAHHIFDESQMTLTSIGPTRKSEAE
ncbi:MAG: pitrilysin family protein [Chthonomonadales bacterium]